METIMSKHESGMKLSTIEKYTKVLRKMVDAVNDQTKTKFRVKEFCKVNNVPSDFSIAAVRLGYIEMKGQKAGTTWSTTKENVNFSPMDGKKIAGEIIKIRRSRKAITDTFTAPKPELTSFSDVKLFEELRNRGYEGELTKKIQI